MLSRVEFLSDVHGHVIEREALSNCTDGERNNCVKEMSQDIAIAVDEEYTRKMRDIVPGAKRHRIMLTHSPITQYVVSTFLEFLAANIPKAVRSPKMSEPQDLGCHDVSKIWHDPKFGLLQSGLHAGIAGLHLA
jgi:hypothetical protein